MRRMNPKARKIITGVIAVLLVLSMLASVIIPLANIVLAAPTTELSIEGSVGFGNGGMYKLNRHTPVTVLITNTGAAVDGEVQVKLNLSYDSSQEQYAIYAYPLQLLQNGAQELSFNIIIPSIVSNIQITIADAKGNALTSQRLSTTALPDSSTLAGLFSDSADSLGHLRLLELYNASNGNTEKLADRLLQLYSNTLPDTLAVLGSYDFIVINDFDTATLTAAQTTLLHTWVQAGGTLVLGTGSNYTKVISGLSAFGLPFAPQGSRELARLESLVDGSLVSLPAGQTYTAIDLSATLNLPADSAQAGILAQDENGRPVMQELPFGSGRVIVCAFDLALAPIVEQAAFVQILSNMLTSYLSQNYYQNSSMQNMAFSFIQSLPNMSSGMISFIFVFIVLYLVIIGPILYIILKKKDKRDAGWFIVPALAVASTLVVYLLSYNTAYKKPFLNVMSTMRLHNNSAAANVTHHFGAFSPQKGDVQVSFDASLPIHVPTDRYAYGYYPTRNLVSTNAFKLHLGDTPSVQFFNRAQWDFNEMRADAMLALPGGLEADLSIVPSPADNHLSVAGTLTNHTGLMLEDVVVLLSGMGYYRVGTLAPGEAVSLTDNMYIDSNGAAMNDAYQLANELYPYYYSYSGNELSREELRINELKRSIFTTEMSQQTSLFSPAYMSSVLSSSSYRPVAVSSYSTYRGGISLPSAPSFAVSVYAFSRTPVFDSAVTINKQTPQRFDLTLLTMPVEASFPPSARIMLPFGTVPLTELLSNVYVSQYDQYIYMSEYGSLELVYSVPPVLAVDSFEVLADDLLYSCESVEIYNVEDGTWEPLRNGSYTQAAAYLDEQNRIQLRGVNIQPCDFSQPRLTVTGLTR